ncbi:MAG: zinc ribbon domain-containing protein [Acidobacteria bacterium]|nr:zinc ribbon domain-containing protein [Acidobacteriota bacterium]
MAESPNTEGTTPPAGYPDEPFACPHCGQMLAPSVRVCASCKQPIDPSQIARPAVSIPIAEQVIPLPQKEVARFSWSIFFAVLGTWFIVAVALQRFVGYEPSQFVLGGVVLISSAWILYDARKKGIPKALRWGVGSLLLWILIFPWYLSRRRTPQAACPFIEGESGRVARTLLFILLVFFLLSAVMLLLRGPAHH